MYKAIETVWNQSVRLVNEVSQSEAHRFQFVAHVRMSFPNDAFCSIIASQTGAAGSGLSLFCSQIFLGHLLLPVIGLAVNHVRTCKTGLYSKRTT